MIFILKHCLYSLIFSGSSHIISLFLNKYFVGYLFVIGGRFSLPHACNPTHSLPSQCCYNLSFYIRLEIKPAHRVYLFSERQPWTFIGRFKVIHINMSLTSRRAKATISKSKIIRCIYLVISLTDTVHKLILE